MLAISGMTQTQGLDHAVLLYDEIRTIEDLEKIGRIGAQKYLIIYQDDCDPETVSTGKIDTAKVLRRIADATAKVSYEWGVLDFETPFDAWLAEGPDSSHWLTAKLAMTELIDRVRAAYPGTKWTFYGAPRLPYYLEGKTWSNATEIRKASELDLQRRIWQPIVAKCDWLAPSIYLVVGDRDNGGRPNADHINSSTAWTLATTRFAKEFSVVTDSAPIKKSRPVMPFVSPIYQPGGGARAGSVIPADELRSCTINPLIQGGADGITCWVAIDYVARKLTGPGDTVLAPEDKTVLTWLSEDLSTTPEKLRTPEGCEVIRQKYSKAVSALMRTFNDAWNDKQKSNGQGISK